MQTRIQIVEQTPAVEDYMRLRCAVGWVEPLNLESVKTGLQRSLYSVCAVFEQRVIGHGRVVGDGAVYFYIQDIMIDPAYQNQKIGSLIMDAIMEWIGGIANHNSFIGLMAAKGVAPFYYKYGFKEREADCPGMFLRFSKMLPS